MIDHVVPEAMTDNWTEGWQVTVCVAHGEVLINDGEDTACIYGEGCALAYGRIAFDVDDAGRVV